MAPPLWLLLAASLARAQDYRHYLCEETRRPFFEESGSAPAPRRVAARRRLANPVAFDMPKPAKTRRILVAGESVAAILWEKERDSFTAAAEAAWPGRRVEHVNAGMTAYNSRRVAAVLEEGLKYDPDLAVVMSGNNETDALELCPSLGRRLERDFRRSPVFRRLRDAFPGRRARGAVYDHQVSLARHEFELRRMARMARERRVPLLFATLPANEKDYAPIGEIPWTAAGVAAGMAALERGDMPRAVEAFRRRVAEAPEDAMARWLLARALLAAGDAAAAREHFAQAVEWDPRGDRSSAERNAMIRRVAIEEGAAVADLDAVFRETTPGGIIGGEALADGVHWYRRFNPLVAAALLDAARAAPFGEGLGPWDAGAIKVRLERGTRVRASAEERREELKKVFLYAARQASYWAAGDRQGTINELPVTLLERVDREDRAWLLELSASTAAIKPQLVKNYWAQDLAEDLDQWWPVYLAHMGEMCRRKGEAKLAVGFFDRALSLSPGRHRTRLWRALALERAGRNKEAEKESAVLRRRGDPVIDAVLDAYLR